MITFAIRFVALSMFIALGACISAPTPGFGPGATPRIANNNFAGNPATPKPEACSANPADNLKVQKTVALPGTSGVVLHLLCNPQTPTAAWPDKLSCFTKAPTIFNGKAAYCNIIRYGTFSGGGDLNETVEIIFVPRTTPVTVADLTDYIGLGPKAMESRWIKVAENYRRAGDTVETPEICPVKVVDPSTFDSLAVYTCVKPLAFRGTAGVTNLHYFQEYAVVLPDNMVLGFAWGSTLADPDPIFLSRVQEMVKDIVSQMTSKQVGI